MEDATPPLLLSRAEELAGKDAPDVGKLAPDLAKTLLPGERIIRVESTDNHATSRYPSARKALYRLTGADDSDGVGKFGPALAALPLDAADTSPEMRLYEAVFGRDSLRVALDLIDYYPKLTRATLLRMAETQGIDVDHASEEEPGRIPHEIRDPKHDALARRITQMRGWGWPYYGAVDVTPEFVRTLAAYCRRHDGKAFLAVYYTAKDDREYPLSNALNKAVGWIVRRLESNPEGLLEYHRSNPHGLENQVWRDSWDGYSHANGKLANYDGGIASIEVQGMAYDALLAAAELYDNYLELSERAGQLRVRAATLKQAIMDKFWCKDQGGYFVLGTDRDTGGKLRQLKIRTSNMGHLLHSHLLEDSDPETHRRLEQTIRQLFSPEMLNISGVRTLATTEARFRSGTYHNGSVWLWDTHLIAQGLEQHGYYGLAAELKARIQNIKQVTHQFPEYVCGGDESEPTLNTRIVDIWDMANNRINRLEQPPQQVQAWSVAAILAIAREHALYGGAPTVAMDAQKRQFETEILASLKQRLT